MTHCCPAAHAALDPHEHAPFLHESVALGSQATHAAPPIPQVLVDGDLHMLPVQHPDRHVCAQPWQVPPTHWSPAEHATHAVPPVPHAPVVGVVHVLPSQQPFGHEVPLHTHAPPLHRWPLEHAALDPHVHAPLLHESAVLGSQATHAAPPIPHAPLEGVVHVLPLQQPFGHELALHTHAPPTHRWPAAHAALDPHAHAPFLHESAVLGSQATHAAPPVPHAPLEGVVHVLPLQQPLGHEVALHTHAPPTHCSPAPHAGPVPQVAPPMSTVLATDGIPVGPMANSM
jgi:hypothetical protein